MKGLYSTESSPPPRSPRRPRRDVPGPSEDDTTRSRVGSRGFRGRGEHTLASVHLSSPERVSTVVSSPDTHDHPLHPTLDRRRRPPAHLSFSAGFPDTSSRSGSGSRPPLPRALGPRRAWCSDPDGTRPRSGVRAVGPSPETQPFPSRPKGTNPCDPVRTPHSHPRGASTFERRRSGSGRSSGGPEGWGCGRTPSGRAEKEEPYHPSLIQVFNPDLFPKEVLGPDSWDMELERVWCSPPPSCEGPQGAPGVTRWSDRGLNPLGRHDGIDSGDSFPGAGVSDPLLSLPLPPRSDRGGTWTGRSGSTPRVSRQTRVSVRPDD